MKFSLQTSKFSIWGGKAEVSDTEGSQDVCSEELDTNIYIW